MALSDLVLPYLYDLPAHRLEFQSGEPIPLHVSVELPSPVVPMFPWHRDLADWAFVPKITVDEHRQPGSREDEVRAAGEAAHQERLSQQPR